MSSMWQNAGDGDLRHTDICVCVCAVGMRQCAEVIKAHNVPVNHILCMFAASGVLTVAVKGKYLSPAGWYWIFFVVLNLLSGLRLRDI